MTQAAEPSRRLKADIGENSLLQRMKRAVESIAGAIIGLGLVILVFGIWAPHAFLKWGTVNNILIYNYHLVVAAVGATFVIITAGIDLSIGSTIAMASVACAYAARGFETPSFDWNQDLTIAIGAGLIVALSSCGRHLQRGEKFVRAVRTALIWGVACAVVAGVGWKFFAGRTFGPASALIAIPVGIAVGGIVGLLNGVLITSISLPPFIVTLGMLEAVRGLTIYVTNAASIEVPPESVVRKLHASFFLGMRVNVWIALAAVVLAIPILHMSVLGRYTYAIGSNERTARLCGVRVERWKIVCYVICGLSAGLAGVMMASSFSSAQPGEFVGAELDVIAAVVIGGTSLFGGEGTILGSVLGAIMLATLHSGCNAARINPDLQRVFVGGMIILAAAIDRFRHLAR